MMATENGAEEVVKLLSDFEVTHERVYVFCFIIYIRLIFFFSL